MNPLARALRLALYATGTILVLTGAAWAVFHYLAEESLAVPANALLMKIHGAAAMVALVLIGAVVPQHVGTGWRLALNRPSGIATLGLCALLAITGYLLYYAGADQVRGISSLLHLGVGLLAPFALAAHRARILTK